MAARRKLFVDDRDIERSLLQQSSDTDDSSLCDDTDQDPDFDPEYDCSRSRMKLVLRKVRN